MGTGVERSLEEHKGLYKSLVFELLPIGSVELRRSTYKDFAAAGFARSYADSGDFKTGMEMLREVIEDRRTKHTLLGKVIAILTIYDIASDYNLWGGEITSDYIKNVISGHADEQERMILSGAVYAGLFHRKLVAGDHNQLDQIYADLQSAADSPEKMRRYKAIEGVMNGLKELLDEKDLKMRFPISIIHTKSGEAVDYLETEGGFPDSTIHLGRTRKAGYCVTSWKKMAEAASVGFPSPLRYFPEIRPSHLLFGVETNSGITVDTKFGGENVKKLHHVYLPGLRRPTDGEITYDAMTFTLACKLVRRISDKFEEIDGRDLSTIPEEQRDAQLKVWQREKLGFAQGNIEALLDKMTEELAGEDGGVCRLTPALLELAELTGKEWTLEEARAHLATNIARTALYKKPDGTYDVRTEQQIGRKYKEHIWKNELDDGDEDRLAFALLSLTDRKSPLWGRIGNENIRRDIDRCLIEGKELNDEQKNLILSILQDERTLWKTVVIRCETIRDTYGYLDLPGDDEE